MTPHPIHYDGETIKVTVSVYVLAEAAAICVFEKLMLKLAFGVPLQVNDELFAPNCWVVFSPELRRIVCIGDEVEFQKAL